MIILSKKIIAIEETSVSTKKMCSHSFLIHFN